MARYLVGIDLGTTNIALAYIDLHKSKRRAPKIETFAIPQLIAPAEIAGRPLLPSFLYLPGPHDLPQGATALPWDGERRDVVGEFARNQGAKIPGRVVTSAKSWLCHVGVDRSAPLLPWSAPPDVPRISPVEATTRYLQHLVDSWNHSMAVGTPDDRLEKQTIVLTVPASFDDVARNLTVDAARKAGLENLTLLEEPQAAFYCWLAHHSAEAITSLKPGMRCLVIDVGGGTTDFSLIRCIEDRGELGFVREAVGDHLLLGGDNMDLALAKFAEAKLPGGGRLDAAQYGVLTQACRAAKEILLGPNAPSVHMVTVTGRGRAVVGGTQHTTLTPADLRQIFFEGFFPEADRDAKPAQSGRTGLHEIGLPYVGDPAISRHLAAFLSQASGDPPSAILFNGGVFQPADLRERLVDIMRTWYDFPHGHWQPLLLTNPSLDLAVAYGAAQYAWVTHSGGRRIGGGIARSYYVAVETGTEFQDKDRRTVLCVVPRRLEEGQEIVLRKPELALTIGQPVSFPLFTSTVRSDDRAGDVLAVSVDQLLRLPPLHTLLRGGKRAGAKSVPVTLAARCTEVGTLELWCVASEGNNRWRLEFNVREIVHDDQPVDDADGESPVRSQIRDVWPEAQVQAAAHLIRSTFKDETGGPTPRELTKSLEAALDASRNDWPSGLCRRLWDLLLETADLRRRSPGHLARWYYLVGYCLRPGFGDSLDRFRVEQLWKLLHAPSRTTVSGPVQVAAKSVEGSADYWIMWRRVAGGLNAQLQQALADRLRPALLPAKGKAILKPGANELAEMWRAAAGLERLGTGLKDQFGQALLKQVRKSPVPTFAFWALTRLGARVLLYGPLNAVLHPEIVQRWLDVILSFQPTNVSERLAWAFCLSQLARRSGQRALDIDDTHRQHVLRTLRTLDVPKHWVRMVEEYSDLEGEEQIQLFGESLPIGLQLRTAADQ